MNVKEFQDLLQANSLASENWLKQQYQLMENVSLMRMFGETDDELRRRINVETQMRTLTPEQADKVIALRKLLYDY
jgi:hypothetical protein